LVPDEEDDFVYSSRRSGRPVDPAIRRMALGAGGVSAFVIVVALLWSGVHGGGFGPPPVILPPPGPLRIAPANPGGLVVPEADQQIMSGAASGPAQLAPAAAAPDIAQLDQAAGVGVAAASPAPVAPAAVAPVAQAGVAPQSGPVEVQLAATVDQPSAQAAWQALQRKLPSLLRGRKPEIVPAVVDGQNIWRVRLSGFATSQDAQAFCMQAKTSGAECIVVAS
jgi:hypothetical protein